MEAEVRCCARLSGGAVFWKAARAHMQEGCLSFLPCSSHGPALAQVHGASAACEDEVVAEDAALPPSRRVVADRPCPGRFPVWASILDDFWILEEETVDDSAPWGQMLLDRVGVCWDTLGLATNVKQDVLWDLTGEVQGAFIHGTDFWRGLSRSRRVLLLQAGLHTLSRRYVRVRMMQRFIGKSGFGRSVYDRIYSWVQHLERQRRTGGVLWESVRSEILATLLLLPTMQLSFITPFCERGK